MIVEHLTEYAGLPVHGFGPDTEREGLPEADSVAWHVGTHFEDAAFAEVLGRFVEYVDTEKVTALIIGYWNMSYEDEECAPFKPLASVADRFPNVRSLFIGDIVMEESEISWIEQSHIGELLARFPLLERLGVRGGGGLALDPLHSEHLRELRFESGGLPAGVVRAVAASDLPNLESLVMWLGVGDYGGDATVADMAPILSGERLPALRHLGLQDSEIQDEIAVAVAAAPVVARLESLDLSMGALTDEGAEALLSGQPLTHLRSLNLHHHYLSDAMVTRVRTALPGVEVDLDGQEDPDEEWRFVAVAE
ncbi:STM4015 family protein [Thermomonospora umbrina]|uniref:Leucine rich repeat (LRR) protein n=1 Tax=Thermomonospora umbrina TaxID=111806 RepID=A0A3D9SS42_9ACTN|nr:STM4015 family protein [Thermomonospora umbrina]REE95444.1 leucine rich repeat (LRR) protein [Thermomonospora umbrina]